MKTIYFALVICIMSSCAPQAAVRKASDDEMLAERVGLYWQARQNNDRTALRDAIDPSLRDEYMRHVDSRKQGPDGSGIASYKVEQIVLEAEGQAMVETKLTVKILHALLGSPYMIEQRVRNRWVKKDGVWYVELIKPGLADVLIKFSKDGKEVTGQEMQNGKK